MLIPIGKYTTLSIISYITSSLRKIEMSHDYLKDKMEEVLN